MKTLLVLLGPTGVGKTELSLRLAQRLSSPILNADSRQIFKGLSIGTAAPTAEQLSQVKHYFVGTLDVGDYYSAAQYEADVMRLTKELFAEGHNTLLLTGGSMMYIDAVCKGIDDIPTVDEATRSSIKQRLVDEGLYSLYNELQRLDPMYASIVDPKNTRRVVHALEICLMTGKTYTSFRKQTIHERPFRIIKIGLERPREELFARINERVVQMMNDGLLEEARRWYPHRDENALNTVGYKEMFTYLDGIFTLEQAVARLQKNTRVYAKKQMTWFKHDSTIHWFHPQDNDIIEKIIKLMVE